MQGVLLTPLAVLLQLDAVRVVLLVLLGRVITAFALRTRQGNHRAHELSLYTVFKQAWTHTHEHEHQERGPARKRAPFMHSS